MSQSSAQSVRDPLFVAQLAAAILAQLSLPPAEVANAIEAFRKNHLQELQVQHPSHASAVKAAANVSPCKAHCAVCQALVV